MAMLILLDPCRRGGGGAGPSPEMLMESRGI